MSIDLNQYVCFNFYKGWREISSFYKEVLGGDISPQIVYVLELCDLEKKITMNQLSKGMKLEGSAISTLVSRMEKKSLLKRTHGVEDRRAVFVQLTTEGNELRNKLREKTGFLTDSIRENISDDDVKKLQIIVNNIIANRQSAKQHRYDS